jgi:hypothetical protein
VLKQIWGGRGERRELQNNPMSKARRSVFFTLKIREPTVQAGCK